MLSLPKDVILSIAHKLPLYAQSRLASTCRRLHEVLGSAEAQLAAERRLVSEATDDDLLWRSMHAYEERLSRFWKKRKFHHSESKLAELGEEQREEAPDLRRTCDSFGCHNDAIVYCKEGHDTIPCTARCFDHCECLFCAVCQTWIGCGWCASYPRCRRCRSVVCRDCCQSVSTGSGAAVHICEICVDLMLLSAGVVL